MRFLFLSLLFIGNAACFDLESIDTGNAVWLPTYGGEADISIKIASNVKEMFEREDSFSFRYVGPKLTKDVNGRPSASIIGRWTINRHPSFERNGNKGWIYVKEISASGAHVRCIVREAPDDGKVLYEREFIIPWDTRTFSLSTDTEHIKAKIIAFSKEKT